MIKLTDDGIRQQSKAYFEAAASGSGAALMFDDFIRNTLISLYDKTSFPEEVRLSKSLEEMIDGDFEPSEVIRMKPPSLNGIPLWRGSTILHEGVILRGAGYVNGDSRKPCSIGLDDKVPHGLLAGATGHGKSVTLNSIINTTCMEYPPWMVQFVLVDAKIVEFKAYGQGAILPHISSIAATSDAEFIISVLEDTYRIMMQRNSVFTKAGAKNITSFCNKMNLAMPHIMITMDEFQTMFMNAARKAKFINELIAKVARLGRNTGVHLLLASQELGQELDKSVLGNIGTRLCLGCMPNTSTQILGNDEAKTNFKQKGRLIINNNPAKENNADENVSLRTPFLPDTPDKKDPSKYMTLFDYMKELEAVGASAKEDKFYNLSFYDEEALCYEDKYIKYIEDKVTPNLLYLGEPSFVLRNADGEKWLRLELKEEIAQNILVFSQMKQNRERYMKMLSLNLLDMKKRGVPFQSTIIYSNKDSFANINVGLTDKTFFMREYNAAMESKLTSAIYRRIMVECDDIAFGDVNLVPEDMELFKNTVPNAETYTGELWEKRIQTLLSFFRGSYGSKFGIDSITNSDKKTAAIMGQVSAVLSSFRALGMDVKKLTVNTLKPQFIFIHGLELIAQLGVDSKTARVEAFKKIINESPEYKVFFIISTSTMEDCYSLRSAITHVLCDNLTSQMQGHLKIADHYPDMCSSSLGIYYLGTAEQNRCRKFKKMIFKGELT